MAVKLLVGAGRLYLAPEATTMAALDADPAAAGWTDLGAIVGGVTVEREQSLEEHFVDHETGPVDVTRTAEALTIETSLAEPTLANLGRVLNGLVPAPDAGPTAAERLGGYRGSTVAKHALLFRAGSPEGPAKVGQLYIPRGYFAGDVGLVHRKDEGTLIPVQFRALVHETAPSAAERFGVTVYET